MSTPAMPIRRPLPAYEPAPEPTPHLRLAAEEPPIQEALAFEEVVEPVAQNAQSAPLAGPVGTEGLPPARPWIAQLSLGVVEVLVGRRPVRQLSRWTDQQVYRSLTQQSGKGVCPDVAPGGRPVIVSVRASQPSSRVIEGVALVRLGDRVRALALRTEALRGRWVCTAFDVL